MSSLSEKVRNALLIFTERYYHTAKEGEKWKYTVKDLMVNDVSTVFAEIAPKRFKVEKSHLFKSKSAPKIGS